MVEYIEREAAIALLEEKQRGICPLGRCSRNAVYGTDRDLYDAIDSDIDALLNIPAADVSPVVHGEWFSLTECANAGVYCSVCHKKVYKEDYAWSNKRIKMRSNYCPNCGASMKDGE